MPPGEHCPAVAVAEPLAPGRGSPLVAVPAAVVSCDDVADARTAGLGADADGVGESPGHALPYASVGRVSGVCAAAMDARAVGDVAGAFAG